MLRTLSCSNNSQHTHILYWLSTSAACYRSLRAKIFEPFEQVGVGKSVSWQMGTGLGLPLCRNLVKLMGGEMKYQSPLTGTGSVFLFSLSFPQVPCRPAAASKSGATTPSTVTGGSPSAKLPGIRVLVADDVKLGRTLLVRRLKQIFDKPLIVEVATGEEALREVLARPADARFQLLLLDEYYGVANGLLGTKVASEVRRYEATLGQVSTPSVIIGVTGNALTDGHTELSVASGQNLVWGKPFPSLEQIRTELSELLGIRAAED